jgi:hypothetical protein
MSEGERVRRTQFGLRSLFWLTSAIAIGLGGLRWFGWPKWITWRDDLLLLASLIPVLIVIVAGQALTRLGRRLEQMSDRINDDRP